MPRTRTAAVLLALALAATAGCSAGGPTPEDRVNAESELRSRPSLEATLARYEQMQQSIRERLDTALGPFPWEEIREGSEGTCGFAFPAELGGRTVAMPPWGFDGAIPDDRWAEAASIVSGTAAEYGFATAGLQIDRPGYHQLTGVDPALGARYSFGTEVNTSIQVTTGCHLPADAMTSSDARSP